MRKLILQINISIDGFIGDSEGNLNWILPETDSKHLIFLNELTENADTVILGKEFAIQSIPYWKDVEENHPESSEFNYAKHFTKTPKIVFSHSMLPFEDQSVYVESGELKSSILKLKSGTGKNMIVYGGARFVASLIAENLIDELNLFTQPVALGNGLPIFKQATRLKLLRCENYSNGIVLHQYLIMKV